MHRLPEAGSPGERLQLPTLVAANQCFHFRTSKFLAGCSNVRTLVGQHITVEIDFDVVVRELQRAQEVLRWSRKAFGRCLSDRNDRERADEGQLRFQRGGTIHDAIHFVV
jgi:hypothetical protein